MLVNKLVFGKRVLAENRVFKIVGKNHIVKSGCQ